MHCLGYNKLEYKWAFNVPDYKTDINQNNDADNRSNLVWIGTCIEFYY